MLRWDKPVISLSHARFGMIEAVGSGPGRCKYPSITPNGHLQSVRLFTTLRRLVVAAGNVFYSYETLAHPVWTDFGTFQPLGFACLMSISPGVSPGGLVPQA